MNGAIQNREPRKVSKKIGGQVHWQFSSAILFVREVRGPSLNQFAASLAHQVSSTKP
jgi:hypothetical protein